MLPPRTRSFVYLLCLLFLATLPTSLHAQEPDEGAMGGDPARLVAPPLPENPTQLDHGAYEYAQRCMACHGDRGQGLTEEWRAAWGPEEENCWQSKCHAANHPPEGFKLPTSAPRLIGEASLARFESAADLHAFIHDWMPWHAPGSLEEATYWQLTAFLLHSNQIALPAEPLGPENASLLPLHPLAPETPLVPTGQTARPAPSLALALLVVSALLLGVFLALLRRPKPPLQP